MKMLGAGRKLSLLMAPFAVFVSKILLRIIKIIDSFEKTVEKVKYTQLHVYWLRIKLRAVEMTTSALKIVDKVSQRGIN